MRAAAPAAPASAVAKPAGPPTKGPNIFRAAQDAMRDQQFGRAHELMRKACEAEPDNQVYSMYGMWAAFRANALRQEEIAKLRLLLRERVSDDQYKAFAYYALGHISLAEKKDDQAEKFFMKAVELDKNNKDAERHLRIIAVRRKAVEADKNNKIFGIEIGPKKSS
jgi:tetratricopeptide (TPR) repeat protein